MVASAQGVDISNWNPTETPAGLAGLSFAICKATEALNFTDPSFAANWAAIKTAGIARGAYHFLHPDLDGATQAKYFIAAVKARGLAAGDMLWCDSETVDPRADVCTLAFLRECVTLAPPGVIVGTYTDHVVGQTLHQTAAAFPNLWF